MDKFYHNFVRPRKGQPAQYWTIDVINNRTIVKTKEGTGRFNAEPQEFHASFLEAKHHAQYLAKQKQREGFIDVHDYNHKRVQQDNKPHMNFRKVYQESDQDTDSVTSSVMSISELDHAPRRKFNQSGISPLNRRRSLRIQAMRQESTMQAQPTLASQNTVVMKTPPPPLERMQTSTRWKMHRGNTKTLQSQDTVVPQKPKSIFKRVVDVVPGTSKWTQHRAVVKAESTVTSLKRTRSKMSQRENAVEDASTLLKKKSTTRDLRQMLRTANLESIKEEQNVTVFDEPDSGGAYQTSTTDILPIPEGPKKKSILSKTGKSTLRKKVTMVTPSEQAPVKQRPKRQASQQDHPGHVVKRLKSQDSLQRSNSVKVFKASNADRGLEIKAPVVWCAPLLDESGTIDENGLAVYVDSSRCFISTREGTVHELDDTVTAVRRVSVGTSVYSFTQHSSTVLAATASGQVLDLTREPPSVFWSMGTQKGYNETNILSVCSTGDRVAIGDNKGNVYTVTSQHLLSWEQKSEGYFAWMTLLDKTRVYHGHSRGVTCYDETGSRVYYTPTQLHKQYKSSPPEAVLSGVMQGDFLYVATGNTVLQMNKSTGDVTKVYQNIAAHLNHVTAVAVGCGVVCAASNHSNKIVCCDETSGDVLYLFTLPASFQTSAIKYFQARLFCVGTGYLYVIDLTKDSITKALNSIAMEPTIVRLLTTSSLSRKQSNATANERSAVPALKKRKSKMHVPKPRRGKLRVV